MGLMKSISGNPRHGISVSIDHTLGWKQTSTYLHTIDMGNIVIVVHKGLVLCSVPAMTVWGVLSKLASKTH